ncbi:hypothetical protein EV127DRAFT_439177 [Xylaria flabelliformis]|nr:hypothetical protein EV127DRAFT_439177 [Xylaria flabelliformis]
MVRWGGQRALSSVNILTIASVVTTCTPRRPPTPAPVSRASWASSHELMNCASISVATTYRTRRGALDARASSAMCRISVVLFPVAGFDVSDNTVTPGFLTASSRCRSISP